MARARNIKPGLFSNEILGTADPLLTILFASLWCLADKAGRLEDRPERIKAQTFPYREGTKIDEMLTNLQRMGFITRYKVNELKIIQVNEFRKHQSPHHTEKESVLPPCDSKALILKEPEKTTVKTSLDFRDLTVIKRSDSLIPDSLIPDSLIPDSRTIVTARKNIDFDFEKFWEIYPKRPGANKTQAFRAWNARLKEGVNEQQMRHGAERYRDYCLANNVEPQYIKQAATFLGPDRHFLLEWKAVRNGNSDRFDRWLKGGGDDGIIDI